MDIVTAHTRAIRKEPLVVKEVRAQYYIAKITSHDAVLDILAEDGNVSDKIMEIGKEMGKIEGLYQGRKEGRRKGRREGRREGKIEGIIEGKLEQAKVTSVYLAGMGMAVEKIAEAVVEGYKKIEDGVVGGYKKIEDGVVEGFNEVSDVCIEKLFSKDGETVEETKERLKGDH